MRIAKKLNDGKVVGSDIISNEMIKCLVHSKFVDTIRDLFNAIYKGSHLPNLWKLGYITPIFKNEDSFDPSNYRGISVCSCLGKLFTLVINERLLKFIEEKNILSYNQIGFRRKYRKTDHIFVLNTILNSYFSKGKKYMLVL